MALKTIEYKEATFRVAYDIINNNKEKTILILHGWGSNKEIMKKSFSKELKEYKHIYMDLAGFGKSSNDIALTTSDYSLLIKIFLDSINLKSDIIMGHSFGGKVATLLEPKCLILLSSAGVLVPKSFKIRLRISIFKLLKPFKIFSKLFRSSDVDGMSQNMYETFKNVVNEEFEDNFINSTSKALCFWGKDDTATPLWTGERISSLIKDSELYPLDGDHFFFVKHASFISKTITSQCKDY